MSPGRNERRGRAGLIARLAVLAALALAARSAASDAAADAADARAAAALERLDSASLRFKKYPSPTAAQIELGRLLFFDPRLSSDRRLSCSSCHQPSKAWADGLPRARGAGGRELARNAPSLLNVRDLSHFFWDGRAPSLEEQALFPIQSPDEMNMSLPVLVGRLESMPEYARAFRAALGGPPDGPRIGRALAAFESTIVSSPRNPFLRFRADRSALSPAQKRGLVLFAGKARCFLCHAGPLMMDDFFHNTGVKPSPGAEDLGRFPYDRREPSRRAFKTPSLLEAARTAPYMHDGSLATLRDVVEFYDRGGDAREGQDYFMRPLGLTAQEKDDLTSFLEALGGPSEPAPPPVLPAEPPPLAEADARIGAAEKLLSAPSALAAPWGAEARCAGEFSIDGLTREALSGRADAATKEALRARVIEDLTAYFQFTAWSQGKPDVCERFKLSKSAFGVTVPGERLCREWWYEKSMVASIVLRGRDFKKVCRLAHSVYFGELTEADSAEVCGVIEANLDRPAALCARISPRYLNPAKIRSCEIEFERYLRYDDPDVCRPLQGTDAQLQYCRDIVAYARARHAGDPALCGDSETCQALMGGAAVLAARHAASARENACAFFAEARVPAPASSGAQDLLDKAQDLLADWEAGAGPAGKVEAREVDEREERIARLRQRLDPELHAAAR